MTSLEMLREFKLGMDKIDSSSYPEIYDEQIFMYINKVIDNFVNSGRVVFEKNQVVTDNLKSLIPKEALKILSTKVPDSKLYIFDLSNIGYLFYINCSLYVQVGDIIKNTNVMETQHNDISALLNDPYNSPKPNRVPVTFSKDTITAYSDGNFEIPYMYLTFVKQPVKVSLTVDCDLDTQVQYTIVDGAIRLAEISLGLISNKQEEQTSN